MTCTKEAFTEEELGTFHNNNDYVSTLVTSRVDEDSTWAYLVKGLSELASMMETPGAGSSSQDTQAKVESVDEQQVRQHLVRQSVRAVVLKLKFLNASSK